MTATSAAIEAAANVIASAALADVTGDPSRAAAVALADRGQLLTPAVLAEITAAVRAQVVAEMAAPVEQPDPCDPVEDEPTAEPDDCACGIPPWRRIADDRYELVVDDVMWALDYCDDAEIGPNDDRPGWYLYGPEPYALGVWVGEVIAPAADTASRVIREHYAAEAATVPGPRLPLDDVETGGAA
ncbi:hypothetical protein ACIBSV_12270 [Embleya sp. NPDC050154]|uniref:hypothetical protein n=1 Tax=Embleya sp. NPDC050154 TaxID=3363988 RepID=UPI0037B70A78